MFSKLSVILLFLFAFFCLPSAVCAQVVINEFSVNPSDKYDWIELFSTEVTNISNWKMADETGDFFTIPEGTSLGPGIYYIISKYQRLDNDKDTIYLYDKDNNLKNSIKYGYEGEVCLPSESGSIARIPDGNSTYDRLLTNTKEQSNGNIVTDPCPTPTPEPTATATATAESTVAPTATPTPSPTPTPTATPAKTASPTPVKTAIPTSAPTSQETAVSSGLVLGVQGETPSPVASSSSEGKNKFSLLSFIFIFLGIFCLVGAGYLIFKTRKAGYNKFNEQNQEVS